MTKRPIVIVGWPQPEVPEARKVLGMIAVKRSIRHKVSAKTVIRKLQNTRPVFFRANNVINLNGMPDLAILGVRS